MIHIRLAVAGCVLFFQAQNTTCLAEVPNQSAAVPTFDCSKVSAPLPVLLCTSQLAASADWELSSAYWASYFSLEPANQAGFARSHDDFFKSLTQSCGLPTVAAQYRPSAAQITCVVAAYRNRSNAYRTKLVGDALAEANFSPQRHKQIQDALGVLGFLKGKSEGVFGRQTRTAIKTFQSKNHFAQSGFLTVDQRQQLFRQSEQIQVEKLTGEPVSTSTKADRLDIPTLARPAVPSVTPPSTAAPPPSAVEPAPPVAALPPAVPPISIPPTAALPPDPTAADQAQPPSQAKENDLAACSGSASPDAVSACTRLLGDSTFSSNIVTSLLIKRAASYELLGDVDAARSDYGRALALDQTARAAIDGRNRTGRKPSTAIGNAPPPTDRLVPFTKDNVTISHGLPFTLNSIAIGLLIIAAALLLNFLFVKNYPTRGTPYSLAIRTRFTRNLGIVSGLLAIALGGNILLFGKTQSSLAAGVSAQQVPLTAQAYLVIPNLASFLAATKNYFESSSNAIDLARLSNALSVKPDELDSRLSQFKSALNVTIRDEKHFVANGCIDFANAEDRSTIGLLNTTSAAAYVRRQTDASPVFVVGPVEESRFSAFLANSTARYLIDLTIPESNGLNPHQVNIETWNSADFRLCREHGGIEKISTGSTLELKTAHTYLTLDPSVPLTDQSSFELICSYLTSGTKTSCGCEVLDRANDGSVTALGDCSTVGRQLGKLNPRKSIADTIRHGGRISSYTALNLPILGELLGSDEITVRWADSTIIISTQSTLDGEPVGTRDALSASVIRDDSFVSLYKRTEAEPSAFFGSVRPDAYSSQTFFNKLVSLPIVFAGSIKPQAFSVKVSINFEPLDATILQDISRDYSPAEGDIPINASAGSASIRIGDNRVRQYVSFADQFILHRLVEGLSSLDIQDPNRTLKTNFIRYVLYKIGVRDDSALGLTQSMADQPIQIILLDDPPNAWAPSIAVAVKFQTFAAAQSFLCDEPAEIQRNVDNRILLNTARVAKNRTEAPDDLDDYKKALKEKMQSLLGSDDWTRYEANYEVDPFLSRVKVSTTSPYSIDHQRCQPNLSSVIGNKARDIYYLSPAVTGNSEKFFYRINDLINDANDRSAALDSQLKEATDGLKALDESITANKLALDLLARIVRDIHSAPSAQSVSESLRHDASELKAALDDSGIEQTFSDWTTVADVKNDLDDGSLRTSLEDNGVKLASSRSNVSQAIATIRTQRELTLLNAQRISKDISNNNQRTVGFIDEERRLLYIASGLDALKNAAEQTAYSQFRTSDMLSSHERIRFYASGDNTVQSILDLWPDEKKAQQAERWRDAKREGPLLPLGVGYLGLSGQQSGVVISLNLTRLTTKEKQE
jgi:peptidoglycan hydrolase-like protein with peptidoglycan-binding domain